MQQALQSPRARAYLRWSRFPFVAGRIRRRRGVWINDYRYANAGDRTAGRRSSSSKFSKIAGCAFAAVLLAAFVALPSPARAWGFEAHKFIADRMIALLPAELKPLFEKRRDFIVERAIDPDLWRNVGWEEEPPNHFLDLDFGFGPYPFDGAAARLRRGGAEVRQGRDHTSRARCRGGRRNSTAGCSASSNR